VQNPEQKMNRINGLWGYTFTGFCLRWKQAKLFAFVETGFVSFGTQD